MDTSMVRTRWIYVVVATVAACSSERATPELGTASATLDGGGDVSSSADADDDDDDEGSGGAEAGTDPLDDGADTVADDDGSGDTGSFLETPDAGGVVECDIWTQDCPAGEKCMPYASGVGSWDATRCSPIDANAKQVGDTCTVVGSNSSGQDDCELGAMCFAVDIDSGQGVCFAMCEGNEANATCADSSEICSISNDGVLALCLPTCNPILQDCPTGGVTLGCYAVTGLERFVCWPDYSFDLGAFGDECEYFNYCDPGLFCDDASAVPGCTGLSCCNEFCDPAEAAPCSGAAGGQECVAWYPDGAAPPGLEDVGACEIP